MWYFTLKEMKNTETSTNLIQFIKDKKAEKYRQKMEKIEARVKREAERRKVKKDEDKRGGTKKKD